jgi:hypothetical protein
MNNSDLQEDSFFEFVTVEPLPDTSRRTLQLLASEREYYRRRVVADNQAERHFDLAWPRVSAAWLLDDTKETAQRLAAKIQNSSFDGFILSDN